MTLIGYWPLNEASGNTAYDHSGRGNHGTINDGGDSTVPGATGILGQNAYSFDGSNDYSGISLQIPSEESTVVFWFKSNSSSTNYETAFGVRDSSSGHDYAFYTYSESSGTTKWDRWGVSQDGYDIDTGADYRDGNWHLAVLVEGVSEGELYLDGRSVGTAGAVSYNWNSSQPDIGRRGGSGGGTSGTRRNFSGKISEVRIYDRPLTQTEIQYLYKVGKRGLQTTSKKTS